MNGMKTVMIREIEYPIQTTSGDVLQDVLMWLLQHLDDLPHMTEEQVREQTNFDLQHEESTKRERIKGKENGWPMRIQTIYRAMTRITLGTDVTIGSALPDERCTRCGAVTNGIISGKRVGHVVHKIFSSENFQLGQHKGE